MRVLMLTLGKIIYANFSQFLSFQCEASGRPDGKVSQPDSRNLSHAYVAMRVQMG
jgi:hypothetical protein